MVDILGIYIPLTFIEIISYFVNTIIAFIAVILADELIAHNIEAKRAFILAFLSFFFAPIVGPFIGMAGIYATLLLPLIIWIAFGELILEADGVTKLKVLLVAFAVYFIMDLYISPYIKSMLLGIFP